MIIKYFTEVTEHNRFRSTEFASHSRVNNHNIYLIMYNLQTDWISITSIQAFKSFRGYFVAEERHRVSKMLRFSKENFKGKMEQGKEREGIWLLRNSLKTHVQPNRSLHNNNVGTWATSVGFNDKTAEDKHNCKNESNTSLCMHLVCMCCNIVPVSCALWQSTGLGDHIFSKIQTANKVYDGKIFTIVIKKGY